VTLSALAQISLKAGMAAVAGRAHALPPGLSGGLHTMLLALSQPWVLLGLGLYALGAMVWMLVLARLDVSIAYPFVALGFIVVMLLGALFFGESITLMKLCGTVLVGIGVWLIARG
jgi:multidrug transporter EmrE-like cation transporter